MPVKKNLVDTHIRKLTMAKKKCERIKHISYILGDSMILIYEMSTPLKNLNVDTVDLLLLVVGKIFLTAAARWSRHHRQRQVLRRAKAAKNFNFLIFNPAGFNNFAFIYKLIKSPFSFLLNVIYQEKFWTQGFL